MDENRVRQIIAEEIAKAASSGRFSLTSIPRHTHNGADSPIIPGTSVSSLLPVPGNPGNVLGLDTLDTQTFSYLGELNKTPILMLPLGIIQGFGVGTHSAFNGGTAPEGTMVLFTNGPTLSFLCIKVSTDVTASGWLGVNLQSVG